MSQNRRRRKPFGATVLGAGIDRRKGGCGLFFPKGLGDKERYVLLKENRYAKSGRLLKTLEVKGVIRVQNRRVQNDVVFKDELKTGDGTEFIIRSIEFDAAIPDYLFTKAPLCK